MSVDNENAGSSTLPRGLNILRMIPSNLKVFENISPGSSLESDLSGPFSEFEKGDAICEKRNSEDAEKMDLYAYFSFSQEFKSAMESAKNDMKAADAGEHDREPKEEVQAEEDESEIQKELKRKVERILSQKDIQFGSEAAVAEDEESKKEEEEDKSESARKPNQMQKLKESKKKPPPKEEESEEKDEEFHDTMSGYWRMLSEYKDFRISPPDYNAYENDKPHWLETKPIPYEVMENSRKKCMEWLNDNFEN